MKIHLRAATSAVPAAALGDRDTSMIPRADEARYRKHLTPLFERISASEVERLLLIGAAYGLTNSAIGKWLHWSVNTVEKYATPLHDRLGVHSVRAQMGIVVAHLIAQLEANGRPATGTRATRRGGAHHALDGL